MNVPRPKVTDEIIRAAIMQVAPKLAGNDPTDADIASVADSIQRVYRRYMDGFELAKELDRYESWDATREDADELDSVDMFVGRALREAEKQWFAANPVEPPLPIGAKTTRGVIASIYEYQPAYYCVKEEGCDVPSRFLLIKFEDAREAA